MRPRRFGSRGGRILAILLCLATLSGGVLVGAPAGATDVTTQTSDQTVFGEDAGGLGNDIAFFGASAGINNTGNGDRNAFFGQEAGRDNTDGERNSFFGERAGAGNTDGCCNAFFGSLAGLSNDASRNAFFGESAGQRNTTGSDNAFFGQLAGFRNRRGTDNSFFGQDAGRENTGGDANTFVGSDAGRESTDESNNTSLGAFSDLGTSGVTNATAIGHRAQVDQSNSLVLGSIDGVNGASADTDVGIGTTAPDTPLHVARDDGSAQALIRETASTAAKRFLLRMENPGPPGFAIRDTDSGEEWRYAMNANDGFVVSRAGSGGAEMLIAKNGAMFLGQPAVFRLGANGNLTIDGTLTENSDRSIKQDVAPVDAHRTLSKLRDLPISTWAYTHTPEAEHLGPMAQDFHETFGLGDDPAKVSPRDMAAVAMSAAQALDEQVQTLQAEAEAKDETIAEQDARIDELEAEVDDLRARLVRLEEAIER